MHEDAVDIEARDVAALDAAIAARPGGAERLKQLEREELCETLRACLWRTSNVIKQPGFGGPGRPPREAELLWLREIALHALEDFDH